MNAGVPPETRNQRYARLRSLIADGIGRLPSTRPHPEEIGARRGNRIGPDGREVLIRERIANQDVVARVVAAAERPERGGNAADLDVQAAFGPWGNTHRGGGP